MARESHRHVASFAERQIVHLASAKPTGGSNKQASFEIELRQARKLESVGRLAARVAHEIDTPIQLVNHRVRFLQTAVSVTEAA